MNAQLTYPSGQSFSHHLSKFKAKVSHSPNKKRIHVSFREKELQTYVSFSLPFDKSRQLAHAILTACAGDLMQPIEFEVDDTVGVKSVAA